MSTQTFEFQTEARRVLELMIHSVYSNKDIFLRELISNASDALDKLRFELLAHPELANDAGENEIRIHNDLQKRILTVSDNGIGMSREELIEYLGTIAKSGSGAFAEAFKNADGNQMSPELIGQFGVGFYSSFMVAHTVEVISRKAGDTLAWRWTSNGDGTFHVEEAMRQSCGTDVILHLLPADEPEDGDLHRDYIDEWVIREIVKKYSDFIAYPIRMKVPRQKPIEEHEHCCDDPNCTHDENCTNPNCSCQHDEKTETVWEDVTLNSQKAIWSRPESEVTEEEYDQFYKHISRDWKKPARRIYYHGEGNVDFRALLFVPEHRPFDIYLREGEHGIQLYIRGVYILTDMRDIIPPYLRFLKGVVGTDDLPLNISRELLQQDKRMKLIEKSLVRKVFSIFKSLLNDDRTAFEHFWAEFGMVIKEGLYLQPDRRDDILDFAIFKTTNETGKLSTIGEYIERMKPEQEAIYYLTGKTEQLVQSSPLLEGFAQKGWEVLLLSDAVDELWIQYCDFYKGKKVLSASKVELPENTAPENEAKYETLVAFMKETLGTKVKDVKVSERLTDSAACLLGEKTIYPSHIAEILRQTGQDIREQPRTLLLNPNHVLVEALNTKIAAGATEELIEVAQTLYALACISNGDLPEDPASFARDVANLLSANGRL